MAAPIGRVQIVLSGFAGAPGLIQMYFNGAASGLFTSADATAAIAAVHTWLVASQGAFSTVDSMQVQPTVEVFEATTGALIGVVAGAAVAVVSGTCAGNPTLAQGPLVQWITADVVNRRLVRGRTFLTPSATSAISVTGVVTAALVTALQTAGAALIALAPQGFVIWHRPFPFKTGGNGSAHPVVAGIVPLKVAVLRSRRD